MGEFSSALPDAIASSWLDVGINYARARGYTFGDDCLSDFSGFVANAAAQFRSSSAEVSASSRDDDVRRLVQYMIEELERQTPGDTTLHEWTLSGARLRFCPLFPFC
jgi:hypothetical protein